MKRERILLKALSADMTDKNKQDIEGHFHGCTCKLPSGELLGSGYETARKGIGGQSKDVYLAVRERHPPRLTLGSVDDPPL